jgi:hypothetical protein
MPIPQAIREACIEIMHNIMKRPCSVIFLEPVNPLRDGAPNYLNVIKKPVDLGTIRQHLIEDRYSSVTSWSRDMGLVWTNCERFNGRETGPSLLAAEVRRNFEKEYKRLRLITFPQWIQSVSDLKDALDDLLDSPPDLVTNYATISEKPDPNQLKPFTDEELDQFIRASQFLSAKMDGKKMLHIIRDYEPLMLETSADKPIDVSALSVQTVHALKEYVTQRLADLGIAYPK